MTRKKRGAFTLTELLIVSFIEIVALVIAAQAFISLNQDYKVIMGYLSSYLRGREVVDRISRDCRVAVRVMDSYSGYTTTDGCLVLKVPSIDGSGNIIDVSHEFDYIVYRIENGNLWKTVMPGSGSSRPASDAVLKKAIESLYIEHDDTPLSSITHKSTVTHLTLWVSVMETVRGKEYRINPGTTVKLMNYEWESVR
jgi:hypothetical protein